MNKPRAYTTEEVREEFLKTVWALIQYWEVVPDPNISSCEGVAFSILSLLDGCNAGIPGFKVTPMPHPTDRKYCIQHGENYYPRTGDIAGHLHEFFYKHRPNDDGPGNGTSAGSDPARA
jgi:hypothetical protein